MIQFRITLVMLVMLKLLLNFIFQNNIQARENPYAKPRNVKCFRFLQQGQKSNECLTYNVLHLLKADMEEDLINSNLTNNVE